MQVRLLSLLTAALGSLALFLGGTAVAQEIYTCVDGRGRTITADRPIAECTDRSQRALSSSGIFKHQIGPSLTAYEQTAQDLKDRRAAEVRSRKAEDRRRDKALLLRYPAPEVHDRERAVALLQMNEVVMAASKRRSELADQRKTLAGELEFYVREPSRMPLSLKRRLEENEASVTVQQKFIVDHEEEKKRVNQRFDEELVKLRVLWTLVNSPVSSGAAPTKGLEH